MFEVGFTEILLILGLALLVLGPEKLPGLARKIGTWTGRARAMANQLRAQLEREISLDELSKTGGDTGIGPDSDAQPGQGAATPKTQADPERGDATVKPNESQVESGAESTATLSGHSAASSTKPAP
ncbi:preprotein translocase subunit TatB [Steroidobacter denitrificans]|uniref:Sec-independent protein translocase protein TatB n=1 Tax=Steroidobacter denitrificans TaxID=465721 RepID=A0A127FEV5_STEDE|nr:Sec-independent protein translocase protein TatB [Steroidobacter denitrificans]AMN48459.1 preprotein translocase subunit TatB [Steroidobacter denitrificans]